MRCIKFRGRSVDTGAWVYGNLGSGFCGQPPRICPLGYVRLGVNVVVDSVGQWVGTWGGEDLYEGDIVEAWNTDDIYCDEEGEDAIHDDNIQKALVQWGGEEYPAFDLVTREISDTGKVYYESLDDACNSFTNDQWEWRVIGNIHDNPEFL